MISINLTYLLSRMSCQAGGMATDLQQSPTDFHLLGDQVTVMVENHIWGADLKISSELWPEISCTTKVGGTQ